MGLVSNIVYLSPILVTNKSYIGREVTSEPGTNIRRAEVIGAWKRWVRPGTWDNFPFSSLSSRLFPSLHSPAARSERKNDGRERAGMERGGKRRGERRERDKRKRREWPYRSPTSRPSLGSCLTSLTPWGERVKWEKPSGGRERGLRDRQETNRLLVIFPLSTSASLCFAPSLTPHVLRLFSFHSPSVATWGVWAEGREAKHSRAEVARGMGEWRLGGAHPRQLLAALTVSRPRSRHFPSFTHSSHPAAVRSSLKASSHGVNDGWRKRKETTHGESERETDERLDQDMRKDDEEPRAAREWGSRSISPVNRSSTSHFCHSCRSPLSYVRRVLATFIPSVRRMRGNRASGGRMGIWGEKPTRRKEECWASLGGSSV